MPPKNGTNGNGSHSNGNGQHPKWDAHQVAKILSSVAEGHSLRDACLDVGVARQTFADWVVKDLHGLGGQYARARELQISAMEDQIRAIADDSQKDTTTRRDGSGNEYEVPDHEWIARSRLRVDTLKWIMSKIAPKQYGDRTESTVSVGAGEKPLVIEINPFRGHRELMAGRPLEIEANGNGH